ncbi:MAG: hypothetical protein L6R41_002741 [Letrouitia leprolyta]|nr:MAG: hypothetical protein L6R41_002741 [Letrouitia leprolyta]
MPPVAKRKKTNGVNATKATVIAPSTQRGIQAFGKITKSQPGRSATGKNKSAPKEKAQGTVNEASPSKKTAASSKRTAQQFDEDSETDSCAKDSAKRQRTSNDGDQLPRRKLRKAPTGIAQLKTPRKNISVKSVARETPTKGARSYLELLDLSSSPTSRSSSPSESRADTPASSPPPATSPRIIEDATPELPEEIQDLINLHSSFLTALSLHYAHNGTLAPADFRNLRPNIERSWRKRRVSIQDVQRLLALQQTSPSTPSKLSISDFGASKICVEIETSSEHALVHKQPLDEASLNEIFQTNLIDRWDAHCVSQEDIHSIGDFIHSLPLAPIVPCTSTTALAPLLAKGQRRLEDFKASAIRAQVRSQPKTVSATKIATDSSDTENIPPDAKEPGVLARKISLLDRIQQKQEARLRSSALHAPLTPSQIQRKAALGRIEEIIPVVELLSSSISGVGVKSFTMAMMVQHLQMSLRNPIEKEEAVRAVRLLAEELTPGWVVVREVGKVVGVTVRRDGMVGGREQVLKRARELIENL